MSWGDHDQDLIRKKLNVAGRIKNDSTEANNKLISKFMGIDFDQYQSVGNWTAAKYNESWDKLRPVVEKISKINKNDYNGQAGKDIQYLKQIWANTPFYVSIERAYELVVEFIKWYNSNTPKQ